jgi:hypothetical protein
MSAIRTWFEANGFGITTDVDDQGVTWANLTSLASDAVVVPRVWKW